MIQFHGRVPIAVHPLFFLMASAIGWLNSSSLAGTLIWIAIIFFSVLIHEYGHAFTALFFGQRAEIHLVAFGGVTFRQGADLSPWKQFLIILNGPLASLLLAASALFLHSITEQGTLLNQVLFLTMIANFFWTALNLLPVQPLDGGKLFTILLERLFGFRGLKASFLLAASVAAAIAAYSLYHGYLFIGSIFFLFMYESARSFWAVRSLTASDRDEVFQKQLERAKKDLDLGQIAEAKKELGVLIQQSEKGVLNRTAKEVLGRIIASEGDLETAYSMLMPIEDSLSKETVVVLHDITLKLKNWQAAILLGEKLYALQPSAELALQNAKAHAFLSQTKAARGWLMRARQDGLPNFEKISSEPPFN